MRCPSHRYVTQHYSSNYWIAILNDYDVYSASITYSVQVCPAGMGGIRCDAPATVMSPNITLPITLTILNNGTYTYTYYYYYLDFPVNYTANPFSITASSGNSGYLMVRREGWPDLSSGAYEYSNEYNSFPATFTVSGFDYGVPGRYVFGILCYSNPGCNVTISGNFSTSTSTTTTTTGSATTTTTASTTTTTTTTTTTSTGNGINTSGSRTSGVMTSGTTRPATSGVVSTGAAVSSYATMIVPSFLVALVAFFL